MSAQGQNDPNVTFVDDDIDGDEELSNQPDNDE